MKSTVGRPRFLSDDDIARILTWHAAVLAWKAQRKTLLTLRELAKELNCSRGTITSVIRQGGRKQASPEDRDAERARRRERMKQIRSRASQGGPYR